VEVLPNRFVVAGRGSVSQTVGTGKSKKASHDRPGLVEVRACSVLFLAAGKSAGEPPKSSTFRVVPGGGLAAASFTDDSGTHRKRAGCVWGVGPALYTPLPGDPVHDLFGSRASGAGRHSAAEVLAEVVRSWLENPVELLAPPRPG